MHFFYAYIDDAPIASSTPEEHKQHLKLVFDHFIQFGVIVNPTKCELDITLLPLQDKVKVIQDFPQLTTQHKLHEFLGLVNF